ncbi:MAG TPA: GAF domain-containing SpoIIE family protein phosphatase [Chthoniobacterales bacterium]|jgi:sigma-B regulation protein RsbU (phosphoserine phosphatase)|nr:GAF domain-containing SpoIIE family protein phosphatase [Chthoniobacterales bacterium]
MRFLLFGLLVAALLGWLITYQRQRWRIRVLERSNEKIQVEENLVFDFLHGLGEAFHDVIRPHDLHRLIVESCVRILDAHGGALYLVDRTGTKLMPAFLSKGCPPLVDVPDRILQQAAVTPFALESYLRSHLIDAEEGLVGRVWKNGEAIHLADLADAPELSKLRATAHGTASVMATPLLYGRQNLGVLAVANGPMSADFSTSDFVVFKSIAEQSAFALYNAIVYSEANEKKRLDHDLQIARDIQRILLPSKPPPIEGFDIAGVNYAARQVSGDYFDYIQVDEDRLGVVIADVSGKGVPASLIMAICRSVLRAEARLAKSPAEVLQKVNRQLYPDIKEDMFISMAYLILDHKRNQVTLSRGGHDAPLLYRAATGEVEVLKPPGMALGIDSGDVFDRITGDLSVPLERDDCLVLYTDGVTEALDANGDEFGSERMIRSLRASASEGAQGVIDRLTNDVRSFAGGHPQHDDITLIVVRKT